MPRILELGDDEIAIVWSAEDVMMECDWLSEDQALEVLHDIEHNHDATIGINWEVINYNAQWRYPNPKYVETDEEKSDD